MSFLKTQDKELIETRSQKIIGGFMWSDEVHISPMIPHEPTISEPDQNSIVFELPNGQKIELSSFSISGTVIDQPPASALDEIFLNNQNTHNFPVDRALDIENIQIALDLIKKD